VLVQKLQRPIRRKNYENATSLCSGVGLVCSLRAPYYELAAVRNAAREKEAAVRTALRREPVALDPPIGDGELATSFLGGGLGLLLAAGGLKI